MWRLYVISWKDDNNSRFLRSYFTPNEQGIKKEMYVKSYADALDK